MTEQLTDNERLFVAEYLIDQNAGQAAQAAPGTATAISRWPVSQLIGCADAST